MASKTDTKKYDAFLRELSDLTRKYGIEIGACGCCDGPYLCGTETPHARYWTDKQHSNLQWGSKKPRYLGEEDD